MFYLFSMTFFFFVMTAEENKSRGEIIADSKYGNFGNSSRPIIPEALPGWSSADSIYETPLSPFPQDTTHTYALSVCAATSRGHANTRSQVH